MDLDQTPSSTVPSITGERWSRSLWATLIVLCGVLFLDALDVSMVGMALPSIQEHIQTAWDEEQQRTAEDHEEP